jgi:hypothetical protein
VAGDYIAERETRSSPDPWNYRTSPRGADGPETWWRTAWLLADVISQWEGFERSIKDATAKVLINQANDKLFELLSRSLVGIAKLSDAPPPPQHEGESVQQRTEAIAGWAVAEFFTNPNGFSAGWQNIAPSVQLDVPEMFNAAQRAFNQGRTTAGFQVLADICRYALAVVEKHQLPSEFHDTLVARLNTVNAISYFRIPVQSAPWFPADGAPIPPLQTPTGNARIAPAPPLPDRSPLDRLCSAHQEATDGVCPPIAALESFVVEATATLRSLIAQQAAGEIDLSRRPITLDQLNSSWSDVDPFVRFGAMVLDVGQQWRKKWDKKQYRQDTLRTPLAQLGNILAAWAHCEMGEPQLALECLDDTNVPDAKPERRLWEVTIARFTDRDVLEAVINVGKFDGTDLRRRRQEILDKRREHLTGRRDFGRGLVLVRNSMLFFLDQLDELADAANTTDAVRIAFAAQRDLFGSVSALSQSNGSGASRDFSIEHDSFTMEPIRLRARET